MSTLVAIGYDDPFKAEEVRLKLFKMQKESCCCIISVYSSHQKATSYHLNQAFKDTGKQGSFSLWEGTHGSIG